MSGGGVAGFQLPLYVKGKEEAVGRLVALSPDLTEKMLVAYLGTVAPERQTEDAGWLDGADPRLAHETRCHVVREVVRAKLKEIVRKKAGGGGYVLYSPNKGKRKPAKAVGSFPTKLGAKRAELSRFPPKDPQKLARLRKEVDRLGKDPKKAAEKERDARKEKGTAEPDKEKAKAEALTLIARLVREAVYTEDSEPSRWDEELPRLSKQAISGDPRLQGIQKNIEKRATETLQAAFAALSKSVDRKKVKLKAGQVSRSADGSPVLTFSATMGNVAVEPIAISLENGRPRVELSPQAKAALTKADPADSRLFRADLVQAQERALDGMDQAASAVASRDRYLDKVESDVDRYVSTLNPLQLSMLKNLLTRKYRKS